MTTPRWQRVWSQTATWRCCSGEAHSSRREMNLNVGLVSVSPNIVATGAAGHTCTCPPAQMPAETCRGRRSCRRCLIVPGDFPSGSDELKIISYQSSIDNNTMSMSVATYCDHPVRRDLGPEVEGDDVEGEEAGEPDQPLLDQGGLGRCHLPVAAHPRLLHHTCQPCWTMFTMWREDLVQRLC